MPAHGKIKKIFSLSNKNFMSGISGQIPGVSGLPIGCPNGNPEYPDIYPEYPGRHISHDIV